MSVQRSPNVSVTIAALAAAVLVAGCQSVSSTARRAGILASGAGASGGAAYALSGGSAAKTLAGAVVGTAVTQLAIGEDPQVKQAGFDQGYVQGQSDAIKREYFLRQALQAEIGGGAKEGETVYYVVPGPEVTADGRKLEPHQVAVRVVE